MKVCCVFLVVLLCLSSRAEQVFVRAGSQSYPLETVRVLRELIYMDDQPICSKPLLPQIFSPMCKQRNSHHIINYLLEATRNLHACQLCYIPACYGCIRFHGH